MRISPSSSDRSKRSRSLFFAIIQWAGIVIAMLAGGLGVGLPWTDYGTHQKLADLLVNVGYGLLGGGFTALIFQLTIGITTAHAAQQLEDRIEDIPEIIREEVSDLQKQISTMPGLISQALSLGIVALGDHRKDKAFEGQSFVDRWEHFVRHASHVDFMCYEDSQVLSTADLQSLFGERLVQTRLRTGALTLRLLVSAPDNPILPPLRTWSEKEPDHIRNEAARIAEAVKVLDNIDGDLRAKVVRQHRNEVLPFTLLRGDETMYVMFFLPKNQGRPILEITAGTQLYDLYLGYFEDMWNDPTRGAGASTQG